jgi:thiol:disulfide interchange protein DsbG
MTHAFEIEFGPRLHFRRPRGTLLALILACTSALAWGAPERPAGLEMAFHVRMTAGAWKQLESSHWLEDGKKGAPRTVYVFTDPNCPYCNKFWADARPWVDSGKVVLRHVLVGVLTPTSRGKAAALLADRNPAQALLTYERNHAAQNSKTLATGRPRPLGDDGLNPLAMIPPAIDAQLEANERLMTALGIVATPAMVWQDGAGMMQVRTGAPDSALPTILGPR